MRIIGKRHSTVDMYKTAFHCSAFFSQITFGMVCEYVLSQEANLFSENLLKRNATFYDIIINSRKKKRVRTVKEQA